MIINAIFVLWNAAIAPLGSALAGLVPAPPSWTTSSLDGLTSYMSYLGGFVCWPAVLGYAGIVVGFRVAVPAWHLLLRTVNVFTLGGFQR